MAGEEQDDLEPWSTPDAESPASDAKRRMEPPRSHRPVERLLQRGPEVLSVGELLAVVLGDGERRRAVSQQAEGLLKRRGLRGLAEMAPHEWREKSGLGKGSSARLCAVFELGRRAYAKDVTRERPRVTRPREVHRIVRDLATARKEHLVGLYLDSQNGLLHRETISIGSLNTTRTHPREILYPAVVHLALGFILAHNHPSGCPDPSTEDVEFTRAVQKAGELMGIELFDHVIVAKGGYTSLRERGML